MHEADGALRAEVGRRCTKGIESVRELILEVLHTKPLMIWSCSVVAEHVEHGHGGMKRTS